MTIWASNLKITVKCYVQLWLGVYLCFLFWGHPTSKIQAQCKTSTADLSKNIGSTQKTCTMWHRKEHLLKYYLHSVCYLGSMGRPGETGSTGSPGNLGPTGATGSMGPRGEPGTKGSKGEPGGGFGGGGPIGPTGATGQRGQTGATGAAGARGGNGPTGATGPIVS